MSLERLNDSYQKLFSQFGGLSEVELVQPQEEGRWSYLELAEHLVNSAYTVLGGLKERKSLVAKKQTVKNKVMYRVVLFVLMTGIRVPVPDSSMKPTGCKSLTTIKGEWASVYQWLLDFRDKASEIELRTPYFAHPVSGPLNYIQVLKLANVHFRSHIKKMKPLANSALIS